MVITPCGVCKVFSGQLFSGIFICKKFLGWKTQLFCSVFFTTNLVGLLSNLKCHFIYPETTVFPHYQVWVDISWIILKKSCSYFPNASKSGTTKGLLRRLHRKLFFWILSIMWKCFAVKHSWMSITCCCIGIIIALFCLRQHTSIGRCWMFVTGNNSWTTEVSLTKFVFRHVKL